MGLDVTAFSRVRKLDCLFNESGEPVGRITGEPFDDYAHAVENPHYAERMGSIEPGYYAYEESFHFRAGAYSRYNRWRDELAKAAGWPLGSYHQYDRDWPSYAASAWDATEGLCWELINFSDCEGAIGPEAAAKLAADFDKITEPPPAEHGFDTFADFKKAFALAANGGFIRFA